MKNAKRAKRAIAPRLELARFRPLRGPFVFVLQRSWGSASLRSTPGFMLSPRFAGFRVQVIYTGLIFAHHGVPREHRNQRAAISFPDRLRPSLSGAVPQYSQSRL